MNVKDMSLYLKIKSRSLLGEEYLLIEADMFLINCCISTLGFFVLVAIGVLLTWVTLKSFRWDVLLPMPFSVF